MNEKTEKPPAKTNTRPIQLTGANSRRVYITRKLMRLLGNIAFWWTTCRVTVNGLENIPRSGPTILLFNHLTMVDPPIVGSAIRFRDATPIGKAELSRHPIFGLLAWMWDTIPIRRGEIDMTALRRSLYILEQSPDILMIAPEGHRNDALRTPKEGFMMLAARAKAVMIPAGISGTETFKSYARRLRRTPITVNYGKPVRLRGKLARENYPDAANEVMYRIAALLPAHLRGDYADLSKATMNFIEEA